jgi:hypothetical protein
MSRPPFPEVIDSTIVSSLRQCGQQVFRQYVQHWKPKAESVHLVAGGAYAKGLEIARRAFYEQGKTPEVAEALGLQALLKAYGSFQHPPDSAKSIERTAGALEFYFDSYPLTTDPAVPIALPNGGRGIEFSFAEPLEIRHPETGNPLIYAGRMDTVVNFAGGVFGEDDKTTSQLGASWPRQWDLRPQFTGYCWGAARAGIPLNGFLVRGVSILKTKYDTMEAITYRQQWMIDRWYEQLHHDLAKMIQMWESGHWDYNEGEACTHYGGCIYRQICMSKDPEPWLEANFERREWKPIERIETLLTPKELGL